MSDGMNVGELNVKVTLDTADVDKELRSLRAKLGAAKRELTRATTEQPEGGFSILKNEIDDLTKKIEQAQTRRQNVITQSNAAVVNNESNTAKTRVRVARQSADTITKTEEQLQTTLKKGRSKTARVQKQQDDEAAKTRTQTAERSNQQISKDQLQMSKDFERALVIFTGGTVKGKVSKKVQNILETQIEELKTAAQLLGNLESISKIGENIGTDIVNNITQGLESAKSKAVESITSTIRDISEDAAGASPSLDSGFAIGRDIITGIVEGVNTGKVNLGKSLTNVLTGSVEAALDSNAKDELAKELLNQIRSLRDVEVRIHDAFAKFAPTSPIASIFGTGWEHRLNSDTENIVSRITEALKNVKSESFAGGDFQKDPLSAILFYEQSAKRLENLKEQLDRIAESSQLKLESRGLVEPIRELLNSDVINKAQRSLRKFAIEALDAALESDQLKSAIDANRISMQSANSEAEKLANSTTKVAGASKKAVTSQKRSTRPKSAKVDIEAEAQAVLNLGDSYEEAAQKLYKLVTGQDILINKGDKRQLISTYFETSAALQDPKSTRPLEDRILLLETLDDIINRGQFSETIKRQSGLFKEVESGIERLNSQLEKVQNLTTDAKGKILQIAGEIERMMEVFQTRFIDAMQGGAEGRRYGGNVLAWPTLDVFTDAYHAGITLFKEKLKELTAQRETFESLGVIAGVEVSQSLDKVQDIQNRLNAAFKLLEDITPRAAPKSVDPDKVLDAGEQLPERRLTRKTKKLQQVPIEFIEARAKKDLADMVAARTAEVSVVGESADASQGAAIATSKATTEVKDNTTIVQNNTAAVDDNSTGQIKSIKSKEATTSTTNESTVAVTQETVALNDNTSAVIRNKRERKLSNKSISTASSEGSTVSRVQTAVSQSAEAATVSTESLNVSINTNVELSDEAAAAIRELSVAVDGIKTSADNAVPSTTNLAIAFDFLKEGAIVAKNAVSELEAAEKSLNEEYARGAAQKALELANQPKRRSKKKSEELQSEAVADSTATLESQASANEDVADSNETVSQSIEDVAAAAAIAEERVQKLRNEFETLINTIKESGKTQATDIFKKFQEAVPEDSADEAAKLAIRAGFKIKTLVNQIKKATSDIDSEDLTSLTDTLITIQSINELINIINANKAIQKSDESIFKMFQANNLDYVSSIEALKNYEIQLQGYLEKVVRGRETIAEEQVKDIKKRVTERAAIPKIVVPKESDVTASTTALTNNTSALEANIAARLRFNSSIPAIMAQFATMATAAQVTTGLFRELKSSILEARRELLAALNKDANIVEISQIDGGKLKDFLADLTKAKNEIIEISDKVKQYGTDLNSYLEALSKSNRIVKAFIKSSAENATGVIDAMSQIRGIADSFGDVTQFANSITTIVDSLTKVQVKDADVARSVTAFKNLAKSIALVEDPTRKSNGAITTNSDRVSANATAGERAASAMVAYTSAIGNVTWNLTPLNAVLPITTALLIDFKSALNIRSIKENGDAFVTFITSLKKAFENYPKNTDKIAPVINSIGEAVRNLTITDKIKELNELGAALNIVSTASESLKSIYSGRSGGLNIKIGGTGGVNSKTVQDAADAATAQAGTSTGSPIIIVTEAAQRRGTTRLTPEAEKLPETVVTQEASAVLKDAATTVNETAAITKTVAAVVLDTGRFTFEELKNVSAALEDLIIKLKSNSEQFSQMSANLQDPDRLSAILTAPPTTELKDYTDLIRDYMEYLGKQSKNFTKDDFTIYRNALLGFKRHLAGVEFELGQIPEDVKQLKISQIEGETRARELAETRARELAEAARVKADQEAEAERVKAERVAAIEQKARDAELKRQEDRAIAARARAKVREEQAAVKAAETAAAEKAAAEQEAAEKAAAEKAAAEQEAAEKAAADQAAREKKRADILQRLYSPLLTKLPKTILSPNARYAKPVAPITPFNYETSELLKTLKVPIGKTISDVLAMIPGAVNTNLGINLKEQQEFIDNYLNNLFEKAASVVSGGNLNALELVKARFPDLQQRIAFLKKLNVNIDESIEAAKSLYLTRKSSGAGGGGGMGGGGGSIPGFDDDDDESGGFLPVYFDKDYDPFAQKFKDLEKGFEVLKYLRYRISEAQIPLFNLLRSNPETVQKLDDADTRKMIDSLVSYSKYFEQIGNFGAAFDRIRAAAQIAFVKFGKDDPSNPKMAGLFKSASILKGVMRKTSVQSPDLDVSKDAREAAAQLISKSIKSIESARTIDTGPVYLESVDAATGIKDMVRQTSPLVDKLKELDTMLTSTDDQFVRLRKNAPADALERLKNKVAELRRQLLNADLKRYQEIISTEPVKVLREKKAAAYKQEMVDLGIYGFDPKDPQNQSIDQVLQKFEALNDIKRRLSQAARIDRGTIEGAVSYSSAIKGIYDNVKKFVDDLRQSNLSKINLIDPAMVERVGRLYDTSIKDITAKKRMSLVKEFKTQIRLAMENVEQDAALAITKLNKIDRSPLKELADDVTQVRGMQRELEKAQRRAQKLKVKQDEKAADTAFKNEIDTFKNQYEDALKDSYDVRDTEIINPKSLNNFEKAMQRVKELRDGVFSKMGMPPDVSADTPDMKSLIGPEGALDYKVFEKMIRRLQQIRSEIFAKSEKPGTTLEQKTALDDLRSNLLAKERKFVVEVGLAEVERLRNANQLNDAKKLAIALRERENKLARQGFGVETTLSNQIEQKIKSINQTKTWFGRQGGPGGGLDLKELTASMTGAMFGAYSFSDMLENLIYGVREFVQNSVIMRNEFDRVTNSLSIVSKNSKAYSDVMTIARENQRLFGGSLTENAREMSGFTLVARTAGVEIEDLNSVAQRLAIFDPGQGITGASTALREFLAGNIRSLRERFEIPSNILKELGDQSLSATEKIELLSKFLDDQGLSLQNVKSQLGLAAQAYADFGIQWEETTLGFGNVMQEAFAPALKAVNRFLGSINYSVDQVAEEIALGDAINARQFIDLTIPEVADEYARLAGERIALNYTDSFLTSLKKNSKMQNAAMGGTALSLAVGAIGVAGGGILGGPVGAIAGGVAGAAAGAGVAKMFYEAGAFDVPLADEVEAYLNEADFQNKIIRALEISPEFRVKLELIKEQFQAMVPVASVEQQLDYLRTVMKAKVDQIVNENGRLLYSEEFLAPNILTNLETRSTPGTSNFIEGLEQRSGAIEQIANSGIPKYVEALHSLFQAHAMGVVTDQQFLLTQDAISTALQNNEVGFAGLAEQKARDEIESKKASNAQEQVTEALDAAADSAEATAEELDRLRMLFPYLSEFNLKELIKDWRSIGNASSSFYKTEMASLNAEIALDGFKNAMDATMSVAGPSSGQLNLIGTALEGLNVDLDQAAAAWRRYRVAQLIGSAATAEIDIEAQSRGLKQGTKAYNEFVIAQQNAALKVASTNYIFEKTATAQQRANAAIAQMAKFDPSDARWWEGLQKLTDANYEVLNERNSGTSSSNNDYQKIMDDHHKAVADAEVEHKKNLLKLEEDFNKKKKELERESFVTKEQGRYDFYVDNVLESKLPPEMIEGFKSEYEQIWAKAREMEQAGQFAKASEFEKLSVENVERKIDYQNRLTEATTAYNEAVASGDTESAAEAQQRLNVLAAEKPILDRVIQSNQSYIDTLIDPDLQQYNEDVAAEKDDYAKTLEDLAKALKDTIESQAGVAGGAGVTAAAIAALNEKGIEAARVMREAAQETDKVTEAYDRLQRTITKYETPDANLENDNWVPATIKETPRMPVVPATIGSEIPDTATTPVETFEEIFNPQDLTRSFTNAGRSAVIQFNTGARESLETVTIGDEFVTQVDTSLYNAMTPAVRAELTKKLLIIQGPAELGLLSSQYAIAGDAAAATFLSVLLGKLIAETPKITTQTSDIGVKAGESFANGASSTDKTEIADSFKITNDEAVKTEILGDYKNFGEESGLNYIDGIIKGIDDFLPKLQNKARESMRSMVDASKEELEMQSPSRVAAKEIGVPFVKGIVEGFKIAASGLNLATTRLARGAVTTAQTIVNSLPDGITKSKENIDAFKSIAGTNISILEQLRGLLPDKSGTAEGRASYVNAIAKIDQDTEAQITARRQKLSQDLLLARTDDERRIIQAIADQDIALLQQQANIQKSAQEDEMRGVVDQEALNSRLSEIQQQAADRIKALQERMKELAKTNPEEAARRYQIQAERILKVAGLRQEIARYMAENNLTTDDAYVQLMRQQIQQINALANMEIAGTGVGNAAINSTVYNINMDLKGSNLKTSDVRKIVKEELDKLVSITRGSTA